MIVYFHGFAINKYVLYAAFEAASVSNGVFVSPYLFIYFKPRPK